MIEFLSYTGHAIAEAILKRVSAEQGASLHRAAPRYLKLKKKKKKVLETGHLL